VESFKVFSKDVFLRKQIILLWFNSFIIDPNARPDDFEAILIFLLGLIYYFQGGFHSNELLIM
jgi:hypothetical protein